jgi:hypothetical protein
MSLTRTLDVTEKHVLDASEALALALTSYITR